MYVQNMKSPRTNASVANQFVIFLSNGTVFQSYSTVCAAKIGGKVYLTPDWDYGKTTMKYVKEFIGTTASASEIRKRIADGTYEVIEAEVIRKLAEG